MQRPFAKRAALESAIQALNEEESWAPGSYYVLCTYASGLPLVVRSHEVW
ncbi:hypothetical protein [Thermogemmatispora sp.]